MEKFTRIDLLFMGIIIVSLLLNSCVSPQRKDLILLEEGKKDFFNSDYISAKQSFNSAYKLNQRNDVTIAYMGFTEYYLNSNSTALNLFNQSLRLNPTNNIALFGKSLILYEMDDYLSAYVLLDSVCKINPTHDKAFYYKSLTELNMGDTLSALNNLKRAIQNAQEYTEPYYLMSSIYLRKKQYKIADSLLQLANDKKVELLKRP